MDEAVREAMEHMREEVLGGMCDECRPKVEALLSRGLDVMSDPAALTGMLGIKPTFSVDTDSERRP